MNWKIIILLIISALLLNVIVSGNYFETMEWKSFFIGLIPSIIASIIIYIFSDNSMKKNKKIKLSDLFEEIQDTSILESIIDKSINKLNKKNFNRVDLNRNMGEEYWVNHINDLNHSQKSAWFIGSGMSLWLENSYKIPLKNKLIERFSFICTNRRKQHSKVYFLLAKEEYIDKWQDLFNEVIKEVLKNYTNSSLKKCEELLKSQFVITKIEESDLKYSIVICSDNINISMRTNSGRSVDSPTLDIDTNTIVGKYFIDDLKFLKNKYNLND